MKFNREQRKKIIAIVRQSVEEYIKNGKIADFKIGDEKLNEPSGAFVTLKIDGKLRGCIGRIIATGDELWRVARDMAIAAATEDNRFAPVSENELAKLEYEVSVLSAPEKISDWRKIKLGRDGVIARRGLKSGVFLPQVAEETGWTLEEFLSNLCFSKAGLPASAYRDPETELYVFEAEVVSDKDV